MSKLRFTGLEFVSIDEYRAVAESIRLTVCAYLCANGWKSRSDTPGSFIMWEQTVDNQHFLVDLDTAIRIQGIKEEERDDDELTRSNLEYVRKQKGHEE
jgi:hypothetical protein